MTRIPNTPFHNNPRVAHGRRSVTRGVVIHTVEGTDEGAELWFENRRARGVGAHLIIGREQVRTIQTTDLDNVCFHAKGATRQGFNGNAHLVGIEHEGFARYSKRQWLSKVNRSLLRRSANRTAWICWKYNLGAPRKGRNVFGHVDVRPRGGGGHNDPGRGFPWVFYMLLCRRAYANLRKTGQW